MTDAAPFHAEHVGSLLRPPSLLTARGEYAAGTISRERLEQAEAEAIVQAIRFQEGLGFGAVTDGEFRRRSYFGHFADAVDGFTKMDATLSFQDDAERTVRYQTDVITGRLGRVRGIATAEFSFVQAHTTRTPKVTLPSPSAQHLFRFREGTSDSVYSDIEELFTDLTTIYHEELQELGSLGATYVQFDDVSFPFLCDPARRAEVEQRGYDPDALIDRYVALTNAVIAGRPDGMTIAMHLCRGNNQGAWVSEGGYDYVAERVFGGADVDVYFLEYDSDRAGGFEPLAHMPSDRAVVLGLISSKTAVLEDRAGVIERIEQASRYVTIDRLAVSPQCGFASVAEGNPVTVDEQRAKLALVVDVAETVWG